MTTTCLRDRGAAMARWLSRAMWIAASVVLVQIATWSLALCSEPLGRVLDEGLQRALLTQYADMQISGYPTRTDVSTLASLTAPAVDCDRIIDAVVRLDPDASPPTVAPVELLAATGPVHVRWYLVHVEVERVAFERISGYLALQRPLFRYPLYGGATFATVGCPRTPIHGAPCPEPNPGVPGSGTRPPFGDEVHAFPSLGVFLVRVSTIAQFQTLLEHIRREPSAHVMENYPLEPAMSNVPTAIGLVANADLHGATGEGLAIAILDTGVNPEFFTEASTVGTKDPARSRLVYEACFSSMELVARSDTGAADQDVYTRPLCSEGTTVDDTWEFVLPGPDLATPHYRPASTAGDEGEACVGATKCIHGTTVAYIAAGRDPEGVAPDGIAPGAQVLAIQVASIFPASHCKGRRSPCAKFLPLDVLRALHHVRHLLDASPDAFGNTELVAVNMSVQVERWCDAWSYELGWSTCGGKQVAGHWVHASYVEPCENAFSRLVDSLLARNVHTVIASGNRGARNEPDRGVVSLPGCVESAVTVGATAGPPHYRRLWSGTMIGPTVDLLAPGQAILTAPYPSDVHGTSYAAPVVSGVLARMRQALRPCGDTDPGVELARLLQENAPISFAGLNVPASVDNMLGLDLAPVPLSCPP